jgi:hypothetical protein
LYRYTAMVSLMDVPLSVARLEQTIKDPTARPQWDNFCRSGTCMKKYNDHCEQVEYLLKPMWPIKAGGAVQVECS